MLLDAVLRSLGDKEGSGGKLTLQEFHSVVSSEMTGISQKEVEATFHLFDRDNDGRLDRDDVVKVLCAHLSEG